MHNKDKQNEQIKEYLEVFAKNFKEARNNARLSQRDITGKTDIPQNYISKIEASKANPTFETLVKLSISVDVKLPDLLKK